MLFQEEYLNRHGITGVPIVSYVTNGSLLLRSNENPSLGGWVLMLISWKDPRNHPGKYHINFCNPVHDAYKKGKFFVRCLDRDIEIEWDRYQDYLLAWAKNVNATAIVGEMEVSVAAWEVFSFCVDGWLATEADSVFRKLHYKSIDLELPLKDRYSAYQTALNHLGSNYPEMYRSYKEDLKVFFKNYCHWLGRLVHSQNEIICPDKD